MTPFVLAIDIGTTSTKVLAVLPNGQVIKSLQSFYPTHYPAPGFAEQDPKQILEAVYHCIGGVLDSVSGIDQLVGISFSSAMHSLMAVDHRGEPQSPLMIWADTRSSSHAQALRNTSWGDELHERTGTAVHPMSPFCKLLWWKENQPALLSAYKFISIKEYVLYQLTGQFLVDYSIASATGLFEIDNLQWFSKAIDWIGIKASQLSSPVPGDQPVFIQNNSIAFFKNVKDIPVFPGASDGCLAQLGSDALDTGTLTITLGTSGAVRRVALPSLQDPEHRLFRYILYPDTLITGGATNNGTVVLDWFAKQFEAGVDLASLVKKAVTAPLGCEGLLALPYLLGERAPIFDPYARGVFFNVSPGHTREHFARALLEAVCYEVRSIVDSVETVCGTSDRIIVSGGFIHAPAWVQMLGDVIGKELLISGVHDASAMGAARMAFQALKIPYKPNPVEVDSYSPNPEAHTLYTQHFERFNQLYVSLKTAFEAANR